MTIRAYDGNGYISDRRLEASVIAALPDASYRKVIISHVRHQFGADNFSQGARLIKLCPNDHFYSRFFISVVKKIRGYRQQVPVENRSLLAAYFANTIDNSLRRMEAEAVIYRSAVQKRTIKIYLADNGNDIDVRFGGVPRM